MFALSKETTNFLFYFIEIYYMKKLLYILESMLSAIFKIWLLAHRTKFQVVMTMYEFSIVFLVLNVSEFISWNLNIQPYGYDWKRVGVKFVFQAIYNFFL